MGGSGTMGGRPSRSVRRRKMSQFGNVRMSVLRKYCCCKMSEEVKMYEESSESISPTKLISIYSILSTSEPALATGAPVTAHGSPVAIVSGVDAVAAPEPLRHRLHPGSQGSHGVVERG